MPKKKPLPEPEPTFEVEYIRKARVTEDEAWEYYIKWGGYPEEENSWEPESNLTGCSRMLSDFWDQVGSRMKSTVKRLPPGHEVQPSALWIQRERKAYRKATERKKSIKRIDETDEELSDRESVTRTTAVQPPDDSDQSYSDPDDIPLSMKVGSSTGDQASKIKRKRNEDSETGGRPNKRLKVLSPSLTKGSSTSVATGDKGKLPNRSSSPAGSLFNGNSDFDDTPPASKPSTPALAAPSTSHSQFQKPSLSLDTTSLNTKSLPAHLQRKLNPRIKSIALPSSNPSTPQGISTKARILAQATGPGMKSSDSTTSKRFSPQVGGRSPALSGTDAPPSSTSSEREATRWLKENMPTGDLPHNGQIQAGGSTSNIQQGLHFSKRWRWTGQLAIGDNESDDAFAEPVGNILLTDNTPLDATKGPIGIERLIPAEVDSLCLRHSYSLASFLTALADFKISQFARMTADSSDEDNSFDDLVAYMTKNEMYSLAPLVMSDREVATMFVFPASLEAWWDRLDIPPKARQGHGLLVAIGFQLYSPSKKPFERVWETYHSNWKTNIKLDAALENSSYSHDLNRAMFTLMFPESLFKRLAQKECAIFTVPVEKELEDPSSLALRTILRKASGCKVVPIGTGSARFIFIHVGAWGILHKLPGLVDRRLRRQDVQFYTYGTDPTVDRKYWGVHEVFQLGGIVTFTPRAIAEDPEGVERLIGKLDEHPLWACYVLPSVIAMIAELVNSDVSPNSKLKGAIDALCGILVPIEKGQIALTWHPPSNRSWYDEESKTFTDARLDWTIDQAHLSELKGHELVLECQSRSRRSQHRTEKDVEALIIRDMIVMQSELREEYRRFVIITDTTGVSNTSREAAANTSSSKADIKDGLFGNKFEFTHLDEFSFGDDYFADS